MNIDKAKELLAKFYDGTTTPEEEQALHHFLLADECPDELKVDRIIIAELTNENSTPVSNELVPRIAAAIDKEELTYTIKMKKKKKNRLQYRFIYRLAGIAAGIILIVAVGSYFYSNKATVYKDTCQSTEEARVEAEQALLIVSKTLNQGIITLQKTDQETKNIGRILKKELYKIY